MARQTMVGSTLALQLARGASYSAASVITSATFFGGARTKVEACPAPNPEQTTTTECKSSTRGCA